MLLRTSMGKMSVRAFVVFAAETLSMAEYLQLHWWCDEVMR
jgi:hypothetical protein